MTGDFRAGYRVTIYDCEVFVAIDDRARRATNPTVIDGRMEALPEASFIRARVSLTLGKRDRFLLRTPVFQRRY